MMVILEELNFRSDITQDLMKFIICSTTAFSFHIPCVAVMGETALLLPEALCLLPNRYTII